MLNLNKALDFAVATVREAGAVLRDYYRNGVTVKYKGEIDLITEADHASEALILQRIRSAYPDCAILSEESGASANTSPRDVDRRSAGWHDQFRARPAHLLRDVGLDGERCDRGGRHLRSDLR